MDWFEELFGFAETTPEVVRENIDVEGTRLHSRANGRSFGFGTLETPTLERLRQAARATNRTGRTTLEEWVTDAAALHETAEASRSLIQVASQFNLLEMVSPHVTPDDGITGYLHDRTQGPVCAMAAAAGTLYRCHLVPLDGHSGQSRDRQIDCLAGVGRALHNRKGRLWEMVNGYALATADGLTEIAAQIDSLTNGQRDELMGGLEIGLQSDTEVVSAQNDQRLSQAYCSALPVAYSVLSQADWEAFARLVLDGAYEATLAAGVVNANRTGNPFVFLTLLGGGAFGNRPEWIFDALARALDLYRDAGLRVVMVSYQRSEPGVQQLIERLGRTASDLAGLDP